MQEKNERTQLQQNFFSERKEKREKQGGSPHILQEYRQEMSGSMIRAKHVIPSSHQGTQILEPVNDPRKSPASSTIILGLSQWILSTRMNVSNGHIIRGLNWNREATKSRSFPWNCVENRVKWRLAVWDVGIGTSRSFFSFFFFCMATRLFRKSVSLGPFLNLRSTRKIRTLVWPYIRT